uniref:Oxysterol-binding protein n=1 Tax=Mastacembelus armatus TaxID=205130 RepID=A0A7N8XBC3_9TELE
RKDNEWIILLPSKRLFPQLDDSEADSWEIIEGLKIGQSNVQRPDKHEGFMLKKRKWPLKGWHKVCSTGKLKKNPTFKHSKLHGSIDVGLSVMSIKKRARRIDLDTEEHIYHLKVKSQDIFDAWVSKLRHHRLYRQNEIVRSPREATMRTFPPPAAIETSQPAASVGHEATVCPPSFSLKQYQCSLSLMSLILNSSLPASYSNGQSKVVAWLQESEEMDKCAEELARCQSNLTELSRLLQSLEILQRTQSAPNFTDMQTNCVELSKKEKRLNRRWRTKSVGKDAKFHLQVPLSASMSPVRLHSSNPNLCAELVDYQPPVSRLTDSVECASDYIKLQEEFCTIAQKVHSLLKSAFNTVAIEKEKIKQVLSDQEQSDHSAQINSLRKSLSQVMKQMGIPLTQQASNESRLSMSESVSEFFDAQEVLLSASSSENEGSDDESYVSDVSDNISEDNASVTDNVSRQSSAFRNGRRTCLPAPCPDTSNINLWNILRNNIGKDLSKVSMPVELNEPLNTLQRMCEELEYSELLDKAAETEDPFERMVLVAAFAISGYSSTYYRAGSKPFNPLLGETYECIREDKGFCFFSEQVSHHPPISACHCESKNFTFWQDVRWKNKFWGKSMEILPIGSVNLMIPRFGDHYEWNKVTTCVHNILSGRRWIEHYGEITIRNTKSSACLCKLTFVKGNYWSSNVNEVQGFVMDQEGKVIHRLFGKWHEGLYCGVPPSAKCIWRPGSMPTDYELYYGFTRFAIELNELCPELKDVLPRTDARFRPDQRYLEEGNLDMASSEKQRIEDMQRARRKWNEENNIKQEPRFFKKAVDANHRERWVSNNTYWELRKNPGFINMESTLNLW